VSRKRKQSLIPGVGKLTTIFVKGTGRIIRVRDNIDGLTDEYNKKYAWNSKKRIYEEVKPQTNTQAPRVDRELKPYEEVYDNNGSTWRFQPNTEGEFELVLVAKPKKINSLSPLIRSGFGQTGSKR